MTYSIPYDAMYNTQRRGVAGFFDTVAAAGGIVSAGAGAAAGSGLIAAGTVAATTVPVVGAIAGTVAIIAGVIAAQRAKVKQIKSSVADLSEQKAFLQRQENELDQSIANARASQVNIVQQLQSLGLKPSLSGLSDWLKKTFTPAKYYTAQAGSLQSEVAQLLSTVEQKISLLASMQQELEQLAASLQGGIVFKQWAKVGLYAGGAALVGFILYRLYKHSN